jgi:anti-anti-sigma factor
MSSLTEDRPLRAAIAGEALIVRLTGRFHSLTAVNALALEEFVSPLVRALGTRRLIFDCGGVEFLGAAALGTFLRLHRQTRARGGRLSLRHVSDLVYEVFEVTRLVELLDVRRDAGRRPRARPARGAGAAGLLLERRKSSSCEHKGESHAFGDLRKPS